MRLVGLKFMFIFNSVLCSFRRNFNLLKNRLIVPHIHVLLVVCFV